MKKYTIIVSLTFVMLLGFFTGNYLYKIKKIDNNPQKIAELIEDECTFMGEVAFNDELINANTNIEKTSPNCTIILKVYYKKCGHLVEKKKTIEETEVNLTEEEVKEMFKDWEVQRFTPTEIVLYKELDEFCGEHYVLRQKDENIAIYKIDEENNEKYIETTDISINYLAEEDLEKIKEGIKVNSKKELNMALEDFE